MSDARTLEMPPPIGDNNPPQTLEERLRAKYAPKLVEWRNWIESAARAPAVVKDEADNAKFAKTISELIKVRSAAEKIHQTEKEPFLADGRVIDNLFLTEIGKAARAAQTALETRQKAYLNAKLADARRLEQIRADEAREAAAKALRDAQEAQDQGNTQGAAEALEVAVQAEETTAAAESRSTGKAADLLREQTVTGVTSSASTFWNVEIQDRAKLDWSKIEAFIGDDVILRAAKAAVKAGLRSGAGLRIFEDLKPINR